MAAGFLIIRLLLVCLLSEVNYSSAFPKVRRRAWQGRGEEQVYNDGNCRPRYISGQDKTQRGLWVPSQMCKRTRPSEYHKASNPLQSNVATKWPKETALPQLPPQMKHLSPKPRNYEFSFNIPFINLLVRNDGRNSAEGHDGETVSKPGFQVSLSVPFSADNQAPNDPNTSQVGHSASLQNPESTTFVSHSYIKPENPQSSSALIVSTQPLNSAETDYTEAQQHTPVHVTPQSSSTLAGSARPFLNYGTTQQHIYEPYPIKPQSCPNLLRSEWPFLNSAATQQQTYEPDQWKPPSSTMAGSQWPFLNSAATQQQTYEPDQWKPPSSTMAGSQWPFLNSAATQQQTYEPDQWKPPSSTTAGSQWPFLNSAATYQQTYEPDQWKPPSSTMAGSRWRFLNSAATQQQTYEPDQWKPPSSTMAGSRWRFLNSAATQQQTYEPDQWKPQSGSNQIISEWPI